MPPLRAPLRRANGGRDIEERNVLFEKHINEAGKEISFGHELASWCAKGRTGDRRHLQHPGRLCADQRGQGRAAHYGRLCGESRYGDGALSGDRAIGDGARLQPEQHGGIKAALWAAPRRISPRRPRSLRPRPGIRAPAGYTAGLSRLVSPSSRQRSVQPGTQPFLKVNMRGERFANESADYDYLPMLRPSSLAAPMWPCVGWQLRRGRAALPHARLLGHDPQYGADVQGRGRFCDLDKFFEKELGDGRLQKADTLEELADLLGFDADAKTTFWSSAGATTSCSTLRRTRTSARRLTAFPSCARRPSLARRWAAPC